MSIASPVCFAPWPLFGASPTHALREFLSGPQGHIGFPWTGLAFGPGCKSERKVQVFLCLAGMRYAVSTRIASILAQKGFCFVQGPVDQAMFWCCFADTCTPLPCKEDKTKARELFEQAANKGNTDAARRMASMYMEGDGVPVDDKVC